MSFFHGVTNTAQQVCLCNVNIYLTPLEKTSTGDGGEVQQAVSGKHRSTFMPQKPLSLF